MKNQPTILVQLADRRWTENAVHAACQLARATGAEITLLSMVRVQQIGLLGTTLGDLNFPREEQINLLAYLQIVAQADIPCTVRRFQYISVGGAIAEAAEWVDADVVFATLPHRLLPLQHRLEVANLRRALARQRRKLIDEVQIDATPPPRPLMSSYADDPGPVLTAL